MEESLQQSDTHLIAGSSQRELVGLIWMLLATCIYQLNWVISHNGCARMTALWTLLILLLLFFVIIRLHGSATLHRCGLLLQTE